MMSGERRQPTRSSYDDPRRADRRTRTAARRIWLTLEDCALARRLTGDRRFREQQQPAAGSGSSRNISRRRRSAFCPPSAVIVFDTFSWTAVAGTLRRPPPGICSSSGSAFRVAASYILPLLDTSIFGQHVYDICDSVALGTAGRPRALRIRCDRAAGRLP
jgi:hypothetical protein